MKQKLLLIVLVGVLLLVPNYSVKAKNGNLTFEQLKSFSESDVLEYIDKENEEINKFNEEQLKDSENSALAGVCSFISQYSDFDKVLELKEPIDKELEFKKLMNIKSIGLKVNFDIDQVVNDNSLSEKEKVAQVSEILVESPEVKITYLNNGKITGWTKLKEEYQILSEPGIYYIGPMELDCSGFIQYVYFITTGKYVGQGTYYQNEFSIPCDITPGAIVYKYDNFVEDKRTDANHAGIVINDHTIIDCAESANGLRRVEYDYSIISEDSFWTVCKSIAPHPDYYLYND